ncbi:hypothetical protein SAMN05444166_6463 [Singulisphaera sp. GP187]|nr:hypothetical protein SAMN05444166_6463 [Singulisphaera sp. GP187]
MVAPDPAELVTRLGASKYEDRATAGEALVRLGGQGRTKVGVLEDLETQTGLSLRIGQGSQPDPVALGEGCIQSYSILRLIAPSPD